MKHIIVSIFTLLLALPCRSQLIKRNDTIWNKKTDRVKHLLVGTWIDKENTGYAFKFYENNTVAFYYKNEMQDSVPFMFTRGNPDLMLDGVHLSFRTFSWRGSYIGGTQMDTLSSIAIDHFYETIENRIHTFIKSP